MYGYFIHTMELSQSISTEEFNKLKMSIRLFPENKGADNNRWRSLDYEESGITIVIRKSSLNEKLFLNRGKDYAIHILVNPSRLLVKSTYINKIHTRGEIFYAIQSLEKLLLDIFSGSLSNLYEYKLTRIDITKDIKGIPENLIHEYILLMRRMSLHSGYCFNTDLEKYCAEFSREDSVNIVSDSQGMEFVIYNKHRAAIDNNYDDEILGYYENTMRMELRCNRKFIKVKTKHSDGIFDEIIDIYEKMHIIVRNVFRHIFFDPDLCYVSGRLFNQIISEKCGTKKKKAYKMCHLGNLLRYSDGIKTIDDAIDEADYSDKVRSKLMYYFRSIGLSPLNMQDRNIGFLQSIQSVIEMSQPSEYEIEYLKMAYDHYGIKPFFHTKGVNG